MNQIGLGSLAGICSCFFYMRKPADAGVLGLVETALISFVSEIQMERERQERGVDDTALKVFLWVNHALCSSFFSFAANRIIDTLFPGDQGPLIGRIDPWAIAGSLAIMLLVAPYFPKPSSSWDFRA